MHAQPSLHVETETNPRPVYSVLGVAVAADARRVGSGHRKGSYAQEKLHDTKTKVGCFVWPILLGPSLPSPPPLGGSRRHGTGASGGRHWPTLPFLVLLVAF